MGVYEINGRVAFLEKKKLKRTVCVSSSNTFMEDGVETSLLT